VSNLDELMEKWGCSRPEAEKKIAKLKQAQAEGLIPPNSTEKARPKPKQQNESPAEKLPEPIPPKKPPAFKPSLVTIDTDPPIPTEHGSWGGFIERWMKYGQFRTDAPPEFNRIVAHVLIATAINRNRWLALGHKHIYPSIYGLCLADSGERKSTPINYGVEACPKELRLANDYSPEALIADLSERKQARGTAFIDEAGRLLNTMRKNHYGEGLKDLLSKLWDAPEEEDRKLMKAKYHLKSVYLNILMGITRSRLIEVASPEDITSGFLARFLPVMPAEKVKRRPVERLAPEVEDERRVLIAALGELHMYLAQSPRPMEITDSALDILNKNEEDLLAWAEREYHSDLLYPFAFRLSEYGYRLSIIYSVSEFQEVIDLPHAQSAIQVIERARDNARLVVEDLTVTKDIREAGKLYQLIRHNPGISRRDVCRKASLTVDWVKRLEQILHGQGRIDIKIEGQTVRYFPMNGEG